MFDYVFHVHHDEVLFVQGFIIFSAFHSSNSFKDLTTKELIQKCLKASPDSFNAWKEFRHRFDDHIQFRIYKTFRNYYKYKNTRDVNEILKDLKQDVYIKLLDNNFESLKKFKGSTTASLKTYLSVIAHHLTINFINRYQKRFDSDDELDAKVDPKKMAGFERVDFVDLEEQYLKEDVLSILKRHYNSRQFERDALIFWLFYFENYTSRELSENFNLSSSGIETLVSRMKKVLIKNLRFF